MDWLAKVMGWAKDDTNEFTEAADEMAEVLGDGTAPAIEVTREAAEEAAPAIEEVGKAAEDAEPKVRLLTEASDDAAESVKLWAAANRDSSKRMIKDSALRLKNLLADYADELATEGELIESQRLLGLAFSNTGEAADDLAYDIDLLDGDTSDLFRNIDHYVEPEINELAEALREAGRDTNALSRLFLDGKITAGEFATAVADARIANEAASVAIEEAAGDVDILKGLLAAGTITARDFAAALLAIPNEVNVNVNANFPSGSFSGGGGDAQNPGDPDRSAGVTFNDDGTINTHESTSGNSQNLHLDDAGNAFYDEGLNNPAGDQFQDAVDEALGHDNLAGAQHGAAVRGSRYGSLVRVGENFTNENITPVGRNGGGSGRNQGGRREYPIYIGDEKLTTLVLNAQNELEDTGRA